MGRGTFQIFIFQKVLPSVARPIWRPWVSIPKPLNHKPLRRLVEGILLSEKGAIRESQHATDKHSGISLAEIVFGLLMADWSETVSEFDEKYKEWKYTIRTDGSNGKWFKVCFVPNGQEIRVITRFQDEYKDRKPRPRLQAPQKKGNA
jgi:hypothetical protein